MELLGLVESPDHVCCRYRFRAFIAALEPFGWHARLRAVPSGIFQSLWQGERADVTLLQRKLLDAVQLGLLRHRTSRLVFDFDDAVFLRDSFAAKGANTHRRIGRFRRTVQFADAVIAGNSFLAAQAEQFTDRERVFVVPTCVNLADYVPKHELPTVERADGSIELVWIGSSSTLQALERAHGLLDAIGRAVPGARLKLICDRFPVFRDLPLVAVPWSAPTEARQLALSDIGISWLPDDSWTRGKCGLKILQYMAAGLPVVASRVGVHSEMIEHGRSGFLVETESEWIDSIRMLAADPELRRDMGRRGRQIVQERFSVHRWAPVVEQLLRGTAAAPSPQHLRHEPGGRRVANTASR